MVDTPNYNRGVGRLATDRFDFEKHTNGSDFNHEASQISLSPSLVIDGYTSTTVRDALIKLNNAVSPPVIQDATGSLKGILKLAGDLGGTAAVPRVVALQSKPVSTLAPSNGQVLTWNSGSSVWEPQNSANAFVAANDLSGTSVSQSVIAISGITGTANIKCLNLAFDTSLTAPVISQTNTAGSAHNLTIKAQTSVGTNASGGNLILSGGGKNGSGTKGGILFQLDNNTDTLMQLVAPSSTQRILGLLKNGSITATEMPANTGDLVMYVADTATPPTSGNPVNGVVVYSESGILKVKQSDGTFVSVGSVPNPSIWGTSTAQTTSRQYTVTTNDGTLTTAATFTLADNASTKLDVLVVGRRTGVAAESAQFNMTMGYIRLSAGAPVAIGTLTSADPRNTGVSWSATITTSGNDAVVKVTGEAGKTINWFVVLQAMTVS